MMSGLDVTVIENMLPPRWGGRDQRALKGPCVIVRKNYGRATCVADA